MRKLTFTLLSVLIAASVSAQTSFIDSFESYSSGVYLAQTSPNWTTWSGTTGGNEDVQITTADAYSGTQSIYFSSTAPGGGPQDVVLPFGGVIWNTGTFSFTMMMKVDANKGAYFNLQGEPTVAQVWSFEAQFWNTGNFRIRSDATDHLTGTYPTNTWFEVRVEANLNINEWELFFDGVSQGKFQNPINQVASLDLFPVNASNDGGNDQSGFYVDDVQFSYNSSPLSPVNGAVTGVTDGMVLAGKDASPTVVVRNLGTQTITSYDLTVDYNGSQIMESITGASLASLAYDTIAFSQTLTAAAGSNNLTATISNVNGQANDGDPSDDSKTVVVNPKVPAPGRIVVAEEATGTWCQWCPRGTVAMWDMTNKYPDLFAGIAVHNGDPMVVSDYDNAIGNYIGGYPAALVNRRPEIDPSGIEDDFLQIIDQPVVAQVQNSATYNGNSNQLNIDMRIEFMDATSGQWKVAMVLTEDSVTGTASGYAQANAYSFQANNLPLVGAGKDWQQEPYTVPASEMVYDHVARMIKPSFAGQTGVIPATVSAGDTVHAEFTASLDPSWDMNKMHIVTLLIAPNGQIETAGYSKVSDAQMVTGKDYMAVLAPPVIAYPNPAREILYVQFNRDWFDNALVELMDLHGRLLQTHIVEDSGQDISLPVSRLTSSVYLLRVTKGNKTFLEKIVIQ